MTQDELNQQIELTNRWIKAGLFLFCAWCLLIGASAGLMFFKPRLAMGFSIAAIITYVFGRYCHQQSSELLKFIKQAAERR